MKVMCPVIHKEIEDYDCMEYATIAERILKPNAGHIEFTKNKNFRERCMECPYHPN